MRNLTQEFENIINAANSIIEAAMDEKKRIYLNHPFFSQLIVDEELGICALHRDDKTFKRQLGGLAGISKCQIADELSSILVEA